MVIARKGSGLQESFTVRKISYGEGVERVFPVHSPNIDHIEVLKRGKVRRAKLYYLRDRRGKSARIFESTSARTRKIEADERRRWPQAKAAQEAERVAAAQALAAEKEAEEAAAKAAEEAAAAEAAAAEAAATERPPPRSPRPSKPCAIAEFEKPGHRAGLFRCDRRRAGAAIEWSQAGGAQLRGPGKRTSVVRSPNCTPFPP